MEKKFCQEKNDPYRVRELKFLCENAIIYYRTGGSYMDVLSGREFVWDEELFDTENTDAQRMLHHPIKKENVIVLDKPWEGNGCGYFCIVYDDEIKTYRMYYNALNMYRTDGKLYRLSDVRVACLESKDGVHWDRPNVGKHVFEGSTENNIVFTCEEIENLVGIDNFYVNIDCNPAPEVMGKYKALMQFNLRMPDGSNHRSLASLVSDDGYNFRFFGTVTEKGYFDTLNTFLWNPNMKKYLCYIRSFHDAGNGEEYDEKKGKPLNSYVRDIRVLESTDFIHWTEPKKLNFQSTKDFPLYTNCVSRYPGSDMMVGLPTRYVERQQWSDSFEQLCGKEERLERMKLDKRFGLAVTDALFMCSRNGVDWYRYDEAFMRPGPENPGNWVYGSCYPAVGFTGDDVLNLFSYDNHWLHKPTVLYRMTLRRDGFVSLHAGIEPATAVTKPFCFRGKELLLNFSTSAYGNVRVTITDEEGNQTSSCELFGDSVNRKVTFDRPLKDFEGKTVCMTIRITDGDVYAFEFK